MIRYKDIAFVAYPVIDIAHARSFYEGVLGLKPNAPVKSETQPWIWVRYRFRYARHRVLAAMAAFAGRSIRRTRGGALRCGRGNPAPATGAHHHWPDGNAWMPHGSVRDPDGNKLTLHWRKNA
jgi:hypothetical protein